MSVFEALKSASFKHDIGLDIIWIDAEKIDGTTKLRQVFGQIDGMIVPGGFGKRGVEGKIESARYAIKHKVPYLGLCLGLQVAVVAVAREQGLKQANTVEVNEHTPDPVVHIMPGQEVLWGTGGSMRLGDYPCKLDRDSLAHRLYKVGTIRERHRHRYEVNNAYRQVLIKGGLKLSGLSPDGSLIEIIEHSTHPYFIASQFHPELKSRPNRPHPLFDGFIAELKKRHK
jgi:CTP synthase